MSEITKPHFIVHYFELTGQHGVMNWPPLAYPIEKPCSLICQPSAYLVPLP